MNVETRTKDKVALLTYQQAEQAASAVRDAAFSGAVAIPVKAGLEAWAKYAEADNAAFNEFIRAVLKNHGAALKEEK